ncbi:hypothetical protein [Dickeya fangzhongdai]|uniref:hypothetical protein n=1 Tax=Dickeya fangzhongdai TaxID=1778540 RepID=UPI002B25C297|nr:hypothetical protein [Dickeya fangzhongdai]WOY03667.1 hypothetical protein OGM21_17710 [Dickeya fangzhongdai]
MPVSAKTIKMIWGKAAGKCSICRQPLIHELNEDENILVGEIAHIVAEKNDGPRGNCDLDPIQRDNINNLILLCSHHHTIIDKDIKKYTIDKLHEIKKTHESWVSSSLNECETWDSKLEQLYYLNVPRLSLLASEIGIDIDFSKYGNFKTLYDLGWEINNVMSTFKRIINKIELKSFPMEKALDHLDDIIGNYISFDGRFRTKNIIIPNTHNENRISRNKNDPHIYTDLKGYKIKASINYKWITTSTASCFFRPSAGHSHFSGFGIVNDVDKKNKTIYVTPYTIGLKKTNFLMKNIEKSERELEILIEKSPVNHSDLFWHGDLDECGMCELDFSNLNYMVDAIYNSYGMNVCAECFLKLKQPLGTGYGQAYKKSDGKWKYIAG